MRRHLAALAAALALALALLPMAAPVMADDPPPSLCGPAATSGAGPVDISGQTADDVGECAIVTGGGWHAWDWFDAAIVVSCEPATGSGTTRQVDGFYLWGITRDDAGAITSQGYVGTTWTGCGADNTASRSYHLQLVLQGAHRSIVVRTQRRTWPYSASSAVFVGRGYSGTAQVP